MHLAIFGATGRTGIPLVQQALDAGHTVVAFVRDPARMPIKHERLSMVQGDVGDAGAVEQAVRGADAVLSALGHTRGSPKDMHTVAARNIVAAMQQHRVRRLVTLTGAGVSAPEDRPGLVNHLIKFALILFSGDVLRDAEGHVEVIRAADLDWVIVRAPMLTDGPHTGAYRVGWVGVNTGTRIARADVADFMLKQVSDDTYLRKAPMISD